MKYISDVNLFSSYVLGMLIGNRYKTLRLSKLDSWINIDNYNFFIILFVQVEAWIKYACY